MPKNPTPTKKQQIGWREWGALPDLGIPLIKAKVDTGARTSALDTISLEEYEQDGISMVRFQVRVRTKKRGPSEKFDCIAKVIDSRTVTNSGGIKEHRIVISTVLQIGSIRRQVEVTLTCRKSMKFRMLIGRTAIRDDFVVHAGRSYLHGLPILNSV